MKNFLGLLQIGYPLGKAIAPSIDAARDSLSFVLVSQLIQAVR